ncbi:MAG: xanthine dehydrogenase accessory protein XdhC [Pseudomonadota bacterium]|jgi:xanthine dehydrogenase accessory factor
MPPNAHPAPEARRVRQQAEAWVQAGRAAVVIEVLQVQGSIPREAGTRMLVDATEVVGTVGGGHLEWQAIAMARQALAEAPHPTPWTHRFPLGPALGQCCGGVVDLRFAPLDAPALAAWPAARPRFHLELYGAGHVGQAIVRLLATLDCTVRWIDARDHEAGWPGQPSADWLAQLPDHISYLSSPHPADEVADAPPGACHLVLTHRHDLDFEIIDAVLRRGDGHFNGLIGSQTKRARFEHRLADRGLSPAQLARLTCPIGLAGITGKAPEVMAVAIVAQLLALTTDPA